MRPVKVSVSYGETRTVAEQSVNAHLTIEYEVESAEDAREAFRRGKKAAMAAVQATLAGRLAELSRP